jgi:hypothetical protein
VLALLYVSTFFIAPPTGQHVQERVSMETGALTGLLLSERVKHRIQMIYGG